LIKYFKDATLNDLIFQRYYHNGNVWHTASACGSMILASVFTDGEPVELFHQFHSYCLLSPMPVFYLSKNDKIKIIGRSPLYTADIFTQINN
jgi:hypothetical protein